MIRLVYSGPYDWPATLRFLSARAVDGVEQVHGSLYRRTVRLGDQTGTLELEPEMDGGAFRALFHFAEPVDEPSAAARLRRMFDLDADLPVITAHLGADPTMAPLVAARPALRVMGGWDGFEVAVKSINGQQISVDRARHLNGVLVERCGAVLADPAGTLWRIFPMPTELLRADLTGMGMPGARVATLQTMAESAMENPRLFDGGSSLDETIVRLRAIRGIGDWTAHYIAMRACRQPDAFPAGDVGLLRGAAEADGQRPAPADLLARAEAWRPWRAYAAHHLWAADSAASGGVRRRPTPAKVGA
ncbi:hypothetical protein BH24ACI5_BH24ACI5_25560 [soil metagenome]